MAKFFVWSPDGDACELAYRLYQEGHDVVLRIDEDWIRPNLAGMVPHTQRNPHVGEIVVFGSTKLGEAAADLQKAGIAVVGAAPVADMMELKRWEFMQLCERLDIETPETQHFTQYEAARAFLAAEDDRFVFKPSGAQDAADTYVSKTSSDLPLMLDRLEKKMPKADFLLQRFEEGVEVSLEAYFGGDDWVEGSYNATFETKKFMTGDIGPATGCSTSTVWAYQGTPSWAKNLHHKFTEILQKGRYCGAFDLNCMVQRDHMYVLEATPRWGLDAVQLYIELWQEPLGDVLMRLAHGELETLRVDTNLMTASTRLSIPPYPNFSKDHRAPGDVPVLIDDADMNRLWPSGMQYDKELGHHVTAPTLGLLGALVAHGSTLERAITKLLAAAKRINVPGLQYRNDPGDGDGTAWQQLAKWGFPLPPVARRLVKDAPAAKQVEQMARGALGLGSPFGVMPFLPTGG